MWFPAFMDIIYNGNEYETRVNINLDKNIKIGKNKIRKLQRNYIQPKHRKEFISVKGRILKMDQHGGPCRYGTGKDLVNLIKEHDPLTWLY